MTDQIELIEQLMRERFIILIVIGAITGGVVAIIHLIYKHKKE